MPKSNLIKAHIHNLGYCSEGIGKVIDPANKDITVFVDNTTIGDLVEAEVYSYRKKFLKAKLTNILQPGPSRIKPLCPLAKVCGGCQWQHIDYQSQLEAKTNNVKDHLNKIADTTENIIINTVASPEIWQYRAKVQFPLAATAKSKRLLIGYYKPKTHEIVNIKYCPVQPVEFDHIINELRELHKKHNIDVYDESTHKGYLRHFIIRKSFFNDELLITFVVNSNKVIPALSTLTKELKEKFPQITGVTVNFNTTKSNVILGDESLTILGKPFLIEKIGDKTYQISDKSFFQINPYVAKLMFDAIYNLIKANNPSQKLLDIYAGVCAISIYVSDLFDEIVAIESEHSAYLDAKANCLINNVNNISYKNLPAADALKTIGNLSDFNWIILDPPRNGCEKEVLDLCSQINCGNIIYVSCNPATMARDIKILKDHGFELKLVQLFDMFCHTYHVESICLLEKNG